MDEAADTIWDASQIATVFGVATRVQRVSNELDEDQTIEEDGDEDRSKNGAALALPKSCDLLGKEWWEGDRGKQRATESRRASNADEVVVV